MTLSAPYLPSSLARSVKPFPIASAHSLTLRRSASLLPSVTASKVDLRNVAPEDSARTRTSPVSFRSPSPPHAGASLVLGPRQLLSHFFSTQGGAEDFDSLSLHDALPSSGLAIDCNC